MGELSSRKILGLYQQIRDVLTQARARAWQAVNFEMVACYYEIGRLIVEEEQRGAARAEYGKQLIREISKRLAKEFGKGFDKSNLWNMRAFYLAYTKADALRRELSWTYYRFCFVWRSLTPGVYRKPRRDQLLTDARFLRGAHGEKGETTGRQPGCPL